MKLLYHPVFLQHDTGMHPENHKRLEGFAHLPATDFPDGTPYLELVHPASYVEHIRRACAGSQPLDMDTVTSPGTFEAAIRAVGAAIEASKSGDLALVRPPGHHAYRNQASGFCLFNNVAIAAEYQARQGKKVLIFDFDGHCGDGTSSIFNERNDILYWSIHQFPAFPGKGKPLEIGEGKGEGYTINTILPPGSGDDIFIHAVAAMMPVAEQFQPDIVAVSAGFDAYQFDLLLELRVSIGAFHRVGQMLRERFQQVFAVLEGGYNVQALPALVENFQAGMNGEEMKYVEKPTESGLRLWETYEMNLYASTAALAKHWTFT